ncbi:ribosomal protein S9/S16-domain-containing protein [Tribonema minus]|uniref:Ribosomal protein S9/S16-domain-containing protein n=1 Tax=Tribonema minus TaxID=303371 RepID=A0A835YRA8_9STRA|nr:ribosomal protein S9/S16-domain-containing protein [Tribonema minus]
MADTAAAARPADATDAARAAAIAAADEYFALVADIRAEKRELARLRARIAEVEAVLSTDPVGPLRIDGLIVETRGGAVTELQRVRCGVQRAHELLHDYQAHLARLPVPEPGNPRNSGCAPLTLAPRRPLFAAPPPPPPAHAAPRVAAAAAFELRACLLRCRQYVGIRKVIYREAQDCFAYCVGDDACDECVRAADDGGGGGGGGGGSGDLLVRFGFAREEHALRMQNFLWDVARGGGPVPALRGAVEGITVTRIAAARLRDRVFAHYGDIAEGAAAACDDAQRGGIDACPAASLPGGAAADAAQLPSCAAPSADACSGSSAQRACDDDDDGGSDVPLPPLHAVALDSDLALHQSIEDAALLRAAGAERARILPLRDCYAGGIHDDNFNNWLALTPSMPASGAAGAVRCLSSQSRQEREAQVIAQEAEGGLREPRIDARGYACAVGRRKTAVARVRIRPGAGAFLVNRSPLAERVRRDALQDTVLDPLAVTGSLGLFDVEARVSGGGASGQAGALRHGLARALDAYQLKLRSGGGAAEQAGALRHGLAHALDAYQLKWRSGSGAAGQAGVLRHGLARALDVYQPLFRKTLRAAGFMTRDPRMVERKKPGQPKARKKKQWVKR